MVSLVWTVAATVGAALVPLLLLIVLVVLGIAAWPAVVWDGLHFLTRSVWSLGNLYGNATVVRRGYAAPAGALYGALAFIAGTLISSFCALVLAVPVGVCVAVALAEWGRGWVGQAVGFFVELIAGVPSVVFGLWGLVVLVPWVQRRGGPALAHVLGFIPFFHGPVLTGEGLLVAAIVLSVMVLPLIAAVGRDSLLRVPQEVRDQGRALGLTDWEIQKDLVFPYAASALVGGVVLALGRALGETMAVVMVSGTADVVPHSIYSPFTTMAAAIVVDLDSAFTDATHMAVHALAELAVALMLISVLVNLAVPLVSRGVSRVAAQIGVRGDEP